MELPRPENSNNNDVAEESVAKSKDEPVEEQS